MRTPHPMGAQWFKCKGCGQPCAIGPGGIAHSKPDKFAGIPGTVECELYKRCDTREFFFAHMAGERLEDPTSLEEVPTKPRGSA